MADGGQGFWSTLLSGGFFGGAPPKVNPYKEVGVSGTAIFGGYVENIERDHKLYGPERYRTAADILANVSIVAAGIRFFLNLAASPEWSVEAAQDLGEGKSSDAAKEAAEFMEEVLESTATSWSRIVRRSGMYRYHGFGIQEWTAKKRADGRTVLEDIESRPQHTIEKWIPDEDGSILGVQQRSPQTGKLLWLPRAKYVYLVDDMLSDSPEGMGLFRHLVEPAERIKKYLKLEGQGFERDLRGIPIARAPIDEINRAVAGGAMTKENGEMLLAAHRKFVKTQVRAEDTGIVMDSTPYKGVTADGTTISNTYKWGVELLTGGALSVKDIGGKGGAIDRLNHDMARILGVEALLLGEQGSGNRALGEDKSRNLYLAVNGTVGDIREAMQRDIRDPIWALNGLPDEIKPKLKTEDVAFKDVVALSTMLSNMALAGAVLQADDPAIDDMRDLAGLSRAPEPDPALMGYIPQPGQPTPGAGTPPAPAPRAARAPPRKAPR
jgi:alkylated DNA nucleotide flippase Atl1